MTGPRWKDIETDAGRWFGLALDCPPHDPPAGSAPRPALRLETGARNRIKLVQGDVPLLWATLCDDYAGVHVLRSFAPARAPIPPAAIDAAVVERHAAIAPALRLPAWSRFFARVLSESPAAFLYPGLWMLAGVWPRDEGWSSFASETLRNHWQWPIHGAREALREDPVGYLDWWYGSRGDLLNLRRPAPPDDGRLKWWRKKARENALPPVLVWYLRCFDACVIVDGHIRLQAALLEDRPPEFIVAYSAQAQEVVADTQQQAHIVASIERQLENAPRGKRLSTEQVNAVLLAAFDDRPHLQPVTRAWARVPSDAHWRNEVGLHLQAIGRGEALRDFVG